MAQSLHILLGLDLDGSKERIVRGILSAIQCNYISVVNKAYLATAEHEVLPDEDAKL